MHFDSDYVILKTQNQIISYNLEKMIKNDIFVVMANETSVKVSQISLNSGVNRSFRR